MLYYDQLRCPWDHYPHYSAQLVAHLLVNVCWRKNKIEERKSEEKGEGRERGKKEEGERTKERKKGRKEGRDREKEVKKRNVQGHGIEVKQILD